MKEWIINGNRELTGTIKVSGAKNALLAIIPASIVTKSIVVLENVTPLKDTYIMLDILRKLNVRVIYDHRNKLIIDSRNVKNVCLDQEEIKEIRASYYFMGALLSLYKQVKVLGPGGCKFASRPIDLHLFAFNQLGYECKVDNGLYSFKKKKLKSRVIEFKKVSVGATVNAILASCRIKGKVRINNVAKEPEVDDLINFLNCCGADIKRDNNDVIIKGVTKFKGCNYRIIEDRIEAGTYLILGACLGNNLKIIYHQKEYLTSLINLFKEMKVKLVIENDSMIVSKINEVEDQKIVFDVYPFLATDLQQPLSILLSRTKHLSVLKDNVYPSRYTQISDLNEMGFKMKVIKECLYIYHSENIVGKRVYCKDLRGGISLVIAALIAKGESNIVNVSHINRGYYDIVNKLRKVGASINEKD